MKSLWVMLVISSFLIIQMVSAQTISRSVTGSAGNTLTMNNQRLTWTVGEPVTGTMTAGGHQLGNGFYESLNLSVLLIEPEKESMTLVQVFPNPAKENITIRHTRQHAMSISIISQDNKILEQSDIKSGDLINLKDWKAGLYFLKVTDSVSDQETIFKIVIL